MDVDQKKNGLGKTVFSLFTLEYPPDRGGVGRYLFELGQALGGLSVERAQSFFCGLWPHWLPLVHRMRAEHRTRGVLVSHVLPVGTAAMLARFLGGSVYGVFFHGMDLLRAEQSVWKTWLTKKIIQYSHALFVNSQTTATILGRFTDRMPTIVTPGIEPRALLSKEEARQKLGISLEEKVVLGVARLVPRKGFDVLIAAMKDVDARLVIIGDGPDRERLIKKSETRNQKSTIQVETACGDEERDIWYAAADVFALPVREEKDDIEGFGMVFLEAALAGLPVVAGRSGGVHEAVVDGVTGVLVDPRDTEAVGLAIRSLLADPIRARQMGQIARKRALEQFQWSERAALVEQAFPLISIVLPVYQRVHLLERALASLARQTYRHIEVIVINNGCGQPVDDIVRVWQDRLIIRTETYATNQGGPIARNRGVEVSQGSFLLVLDHDAILRRDALEIFLRTLQDHPEVDVVYSSHRFGWKLFRGQSFDPMALKRGNYIHTTSLMRREAFPGFDVALMKFQDWDLWLTMVERGSKMMWVDKTLFSLKAGGTMSGWMPSFAYRLPWANIGWTPKRLVRYREAEQVIRKKHHLI